MTTHLRASSVNLNPRSYYKKLKRSYKIKKKDILREREILKENARLQEIYEKYRDFTMVDPRDYLENLRFSQNWLKDHGLHGGCVIECGTWRGGISFGMVEALTEVEEFHCFDSFEGLPKAGPLDGELAAQLQEKGELIAVNNIASLEEFMEGFNLLDKELRDKVHVHKGWFEDTFKDFRSERPISLLRIDCDWYDSVMLVLDTFFNLVQKNGLIVIDDYMHWEGCSRAVHDFLSKRKARERIQQVSSEGIVFMVKDFPEQ